MAEVSQKTETSQESAPQTTGTAEAGDRVDEGVANTEALDAMMKANEAMLQGMAEMQREIMEFGNTRLREDLDIQEALSHCGDLQEAFQMQADFTQKAMQQYAEETAKLLNLSAKVGRDFWGPFENATRVAFQTVKKR